MGLTKVSFSMVDGAATSVLDYGADPTGASASDAAIQAALNASDDVYLAPGTFKITAPFTVASNKRLWGAGNGSTILDITADTICLRVTGSGVRLGYFSVTVSSGTHTVSGIEVGDGVTPAGRCVIDSVSVDGAGLHGFEIRSGNLGNIHNCNASNCGGNGLNFGIESIDTNSWTMDGYNEFSNNTLDGVHISGNNTANSSRAHQLNGIVSQNNGRYGVYVNSGQSIINAYCEASGTADFYIDTYGVGNQVSTTNGVVTDNGSGNLIVNYNVQGDYSRQIAVNGVKFNAAAGYHTTDPNTLDQYDETTYTPTLTGFTLTGTASATSAHCVKIGRFVTGQITLTPSGGTIASVAGTSYLDLPFLTSTTTSGIWTCAAINSVSATSYGIGTIGNGRMYTPAWSATSDPVIISYSYMADN